MPSDDRVYHTQNKHQRQIFWEIAVDLQEQNTSETVKPRVEEAWPAQRGDIFVSAEVFMKVSA